MSVSVTFFDVTGFFQAVADPSVSGVLNQPIVQPINALVTFTPRLARGQTFYIEDYLVSPAYNAVQTVTLIGSSGLAPTGGTWTLSYSGHTTDPPLAWDIAPADLQTALAALPAIGSGNVHVVAGPAGLSYNVEFTGTLGDQVMAPMIGNGDLLTNPEGAGFCEVTVAVATVGSAEIIADTAIAIPPLTAAIYNGVLSAIDYADTPGFQLPANVAALNLAQLIYDVTFTNVTFNDATQFLAPFAFAAPSDTTPVCLTDPDLTRLPYQPPSTSTWVPSAPLGSPTPLMLVSGGRSR